MDSRNTLHRLIDELLEEDLAAAEQVDDDDFDGGLTEARADVLAGRVVSHEEVKRPWGLK